MASEKTEKEGKRLDWKEKARRWKRNKGRGTEERRVEKRKSGGGEEEEKEEGAGMESDSDQKGDGEGFADGGVGC